MAKMLTAKTVANAKPGPTRREIPDGGTGLYLVVQPSGSMSWAYRYRFRGTPRKLTLGAFPIVPLGDTRNAQGQIIVKGARTLAGAAREAVAQGRDPAADKAATDDDGPDQDLFPNRLIQFIERYAKPKNRSWKDSAATLGLRPNDSGELQVVPDGIAAKWRNRKVQEIAKRDIIDLLDLIVDQGYPIRANRVFSALRKFFNWLIERDVVLHSPCAGLKAPSPENSRDRVLADTEIKWLWQACENIGYPFGTLGQLLLVTGQRRTEVAGIADSELDTKEALWSLPGNRTKNKKPHTVPLSDLAVSLIERGPRVPSEAGLIFTTTGLTPVSGFSKAKAELDEEMAAIAAKEKGEAVKIEPWQFHDLRHSLKTWMQEARIEKDVRDAVQNHHTKDMDARYGHYTFADEKRAALEGWARHLDAIVTGKTAKVIKLRA